jgi:radical SAM protein with 4Fe4S-binding SPASM domain
VLDECAARGWMAPDVEVYPYVAIINAMTEHCGFIGKIKRFEDFDATFSDIQRAFYEKIGRFRGSGKSFEAVQYYPNRIEINCAAVSHNAVVFGPNGRMYKCGLDVGDDHRAHAALALDGASAPVAASAGPAPLPADRWDRYDPFRHDRCSECQYLPVCMGGCPKAQIERDEPQLRLQSEFWENNFDRIIREYFRASGGH